jgi:mannose-6-phosphate isomerase
MILRVLQPMKLKAACKDYIWGGNRLRLEYGQQSEAEKVAESWMLSAHPDGPSVIENGEDKGMTLQQYLQKAGESVLGTDCAKFPYFPVLIKLIDAKDKLSIQVHPDDVYARAHGGGFGKTEMWYILDCEPGAGLYYGFDHEISREEFARRINDGTLEEVLHRAEVHPGDMFFIKAGTLHAIGAGILLAEVQQNSNLTYRIYDYGRLGKDGKPRELHVEQAKEVTQLKPADCPVGPRGSREERKGYSRLLLASCPVFTVYEMKVENAELNADETSFHSLICLDGEADLLKEGKPVLSLKKGESVFIPAGYGSYTVKGSCRLLHTTV